MIQRDDGSRALAVNFPDLLARVDNDHELLRDMLSMFKKDFPCLLQLLQEAVGHEDMKDVETACHTLRGMLLNFSVTRAAVAAARIEEMARQSDKAGLRDALGVFVKEVADLVPELERYVGEVRQ